MTNDETLNGPIEAPHTCPGCGRAIEADESYLAIEQIAMRGYGLGAQELEDGLVGDRKSCKVHATTATLHERQFGLEGQSAGNYNVVLRWGAGAAPHLAFASAKVFSSGELGTRRTPYTERDS